MASTIFHHWLDQLRALPRARRWVLVGSFWVLGLVVVFSGGMLVGRGLGQVHQMTVQVRAVTAQNVALQGQLQSLQQQQRTASTALAALRESLAERDATLQKLKREQATYDKLIGSDGDRSGLGVYAVALTPVGRTDAWNFVVTLVNTAKHADTARGLLTVTVEGVRSSKLVSLSWPTVAGPRAGRGLPYAFKFFQQVPGSLVLPKGFVPNRVVVTLTPAGGHAVSRGFSWSDAVVPVAQLPHAP